MTDDCLLIPLQAYLDELEAQAQAAEAKTAEAAAKKKEVTGVPPPPRRNKVRGAPMTLMAA